MTLGLQSHLHRHAILLSAKTGMAIMCNDNSLILQ